MNATETLIEALLWYAVPNIMLNIMATFWLVGNQRNRRRMGDEVAVWPWAPYSLAVGSVLPFVTGPMAVSAWYDAARRGHNRRLWLAVVTVLSFFGYIGYRVYDDAESRGEPAAVWSVAAMAYYIVLIALAGFGIAGAAGATVEGLGWLAGLFQAQYLLMVIPGFLLLLVAFPVVYGAMRARLDFDGVYRRLRQRGQIVDTGDNLLAVDDLQTYFPLRGGVFSTVTGYVRAVDGVSFRLKAGEVLGLVGESGCGKTTVGRTLLGLIKATGGRVVFRGVDLSLLNAAEMRAMRRQMQVIFQDPVGSLNPRMSVGAIVGEGLAIHGIGNRRQRREKVADLLDRVGLGREALNRYPHEFSGGQRQRIGIARALAMGADFIVCDEPVSALDVSIQAQIINLLQDLQKEFRFSYIFIAHDLAVVEHISDRVAVMYLGKIAEVAGRDELYARPLHPYTGALLAAIPVADPKRKHKVVSLGGEIPSPINPPSGCRFRTRCPKAIARCAEVVPELVDYGNGHQAACIRIPEWVDRGRVPLGEQP